MQYTPEQLKEILRKHDLWWLGESGGERAYLRGANLRRANLGVANLRRANLGVANLRRANLNGADLNGADLTDANLTDAYLGVANLRRANLGGANLRRAGLTDANLRGADLRGADLRGAGLTDANLREADLRGADLRGANLRGSNLRGADLENVTMSWNSHELIGERLRQVAGKDYDRLALAGAISQNTHLCWDYWLDNTPLEIRAWALGVMKTWIKDGDDLPDEFRDAIGKQADSEGIAT